MALDKQDVLRTDQRQPGMIGNYAVAQEWLSRLGNDRWLLIFYNYDVDLPHHDISAHEKAAQTDTTYDLKTFFPSDFRGSILITTRNSNLAETIGAQEHHLKRLDPTIEGLKVLLKRSKREQQHEDPSAVKLAQRFDGFSLALATAGPYLKTTTRTFKDYLELYELKWRRLGMEAGRKRLGEYAKTLYTTWDLSIERVRKQEPHAVDFLHLLANSDKNGASHGLIRCGLTDHQSLEIPDRHNAASVQSANPNHHDTTAQIPKVGRQRGRADRVDLFPSCIVEIMSDDLRFNSIIESLQAFSLLKRQTHFQTFGMHTCFHDYILNSLNQPPDQSLDWIAVHCIGQASRLRMKQQNSADATSNASEPIEDRDVKRHARALLDHRLKDLLTDTPQLCISDTLSTNLSMFSDIWMNMDTAAVSEARRISWTVYKNGTESIENNPPSWKVLAVCLRLHITVRVEAVEQHVIQICTNSRFLLALENDNGPSSIALAWCLGEFCSYRDRFGFAERMYLIGMRKGANRDGQYNIADISSVVRLY